MESTGEPSSDSEEEDQAQNFLVKDPNAELPPEHWQIGKLVKYIKVRRAYEMLPYGSFGSHFTLSITRVVTKHQQLYPCALFTTCR